MSPSVKAIQKQLKENASTGHAGFLDKMVPGQQRVYGVKTPIMNQLAKEYSNGSFALAKELWQSGTLEEQIIAIKIIERVGKKDPDKVLPLFLKFSVNINNWAVCDGLGMQFLRGIVKTHANEIFALANKLNRSKNSWQRRLSLVMLEWYTRDKTYHPQIKKLVMNVENDEEYYVRKAIGWINRNLAKAKGFERRGSSRERNT